MNNIINEQSKIERIVMRRVRIIRVLRPFISSGALAAVVFVFAVKFILNDSLNPTL